ncbi:Teichuronic acid biosynthesis protein TuaB [Streptomyces sp. RB5]|uniref:Teichuronic acid biosynthesis protein TuaB n=1 Tax=Streptomyces smaragdinus TaxID=2585196 RepID=A0A7K0CLU1_9ACTN|nr:lipopolysaccharide biosynthesis protein [Streptomyces smaragdinus]MQY14381.1 Teichuronic acid biosynthesis protein TuaB [Streptomyces smaragdinus]
MDGVRTAPPLSPEDTLALRLPPGLQGSGLAEPPGSGLPHDRLAGKVSRAARWSLVNTLVMRLGNFATGIVLARFVLDPAAWGVYAVAQTVLMVLLSANELGVTLAIVRWDGDVRRFAPTVLTLSTASSCTLYAAVFCAAPSIAGLLGSPSAAAVLRVMCLCLVIDGLSLVPAGVITREFAQHKRLAIDAVNFLLATGITLALAFRGWGAMSFAVGAVCGNLSALVGCALAARGMLRFGWDREQAGALLRFGLPLAGASLLALGVVNLDAMIVGATLGPVALGLYMIAFNMAGWPVRIISEASRRVSFAGFSRVADSPRDLVRGFARALKLLVTVTVPICVLLAALAGPAVRLLYGEKWVPAAQALPWLMALGLTRIGSELAYDCLVAVGKRRSLMALQGLWLVTLLPVLLIAARSGDIREVAMGHVVVAGGVVVPAFLFVLHRAGIPARVVAVACARAFFGGAMTAWVVILLHRRMGDGTAEVVMTAAIGVISYGLCTVPGSDLLPRTPKVKPRPRHRKARG